MGKMHWEKCIWEKEIWDFVDLGKVHGGKKIRDFVVGGKSAFWKSENGKNSWRLLVV